MDELLETIKNSEMLTEDVKKELADGIKQRITEAVEVASKEAEIEVRATLTEQYVEDFNLLTEAIDAKVEQTLKSEIEELKEDIQNYRDLKVEYADRLVEARAEIATTVKSDMKKLVEMLDTFLSEAIREELDELKEDIAEVRKISFGKEIFESVVSTFKKQFVEDAQIFETLKVTQEKLEEAETKYTDISAKLVETSHTIKLNSVLDSLQDRPREVMVAILKNVPTEKLEETYTKYIGRVLNESIQNSEKSEKENDANKTSLNEDKSSVLAESIENKSAAVKYGNLENLTASEDKTDMVSGYEDEIALLKRQAGIV